MKLEETFLHCFIKQMGILNMLTFVSHNASRVRTSSGGGVVLYRQGLRLTLVRGPDYVLFTLSIISIAAGAFSTLQKAANSDTQSLKNTFKGKYCFTF